MAWLPAGSAWRHGIPGRGAAWDQRDQRGHARAVNKQRLLRRIDGAAAPVGASRGARVVNAALEAGRRIETVIARALKPLAAFSAVPEGKTEQIGKLKRGIEQRFRQGR